MRRRLVPLLALLLTARAGLAQNPFISGTVAATDAAVSLSTPGVGTAAITVTNTWTATLNFEKTVNGSTWSVMQCITEDTGTLGTSTTANGTFACAAAGARQVRVRANPYSSGTATVAISSGPGSTTVMLARPLPAGSAAIGTVTVTDGSGPVTVDGTVTANAGTNLNTSALALESTLGTRAADSTLTGRFPAGANPADNESNSASISRLGSYLFQFDGTTWDRWQGLVKLSQTSTDNDVDVTSSALPTGAATEATLATRAADATITGRLPAGSTPADNESNTVTTSRLGSYLWIFDGSTWDRWTGAVTISTFPDNEPFNQQQVAGTAVSVDDGNSDAGTQRVVVAPNLVTTANNDGACVSVTTSTTTVLASFSTRAWASIVNQGTATVYLKFGATATSSDFPLPAGAAFNWPSGARTYTGVVDAISASGTQSVCVVEW